MKSSISYSLVIFTLLVSFSCTKLTSGGSDVTYPLSFDIVAAPYTKTDAGSKFSPSVWAFDKNGDAFMQDSPLSFREGLNWVSDQHANWPESTLDIYAYSPGGRAEFSKEKGITFKDYKAEEALELYYGEPIISRQRETSNGLVGVRMVSPFAQVRFYLYSALPVYASLTVKKLELLGLSSQGTFTSLPDPAWSVDSQEDDVVYFEGEALAKEYPTVVGEALLCIPQEDQIMVRITCDLSTGTSELVDEVYTFKIDTRWKLGRSYEYIIRASGVGGLNLELEKYKQI